MLKAGSACSDSECEDLHEGSMNTSFGAEDCLLMCAKARLGMQSTRAARRYTIRPRLPRDPMNSPWPRIICPIDCHMN